MSLFSFSFFSKDEWWVTGCKHFLWFPLKSKIKVFTHKLKFNGMKGCRQWHTYLLDIFRALRLLGSSWAFVLLWTSAYQVYRAQPFVYFFSYHVERDFMTRESMFCQKLFSSKQNWQVARNVLVLLWVWILISGQLLLVLVHIAIASHHCCEQRMRAGSWCQRQYLLAQPEVPAPQVGCGEGVSPSLPFPLYLGGGG